MRHPDRLSILEDVCVVIPVLNDYVDLQRLLQDLSRFHFGAIVVVDGGSREKPDSLPFGARLITSDQGRGTQIRKGIEITQQPWVWMLHSDTRLPSDSVEIFARHLSNQPSWGWFDVNLMPSTKLLRLVQWSMNHRSRLVKIATGDQGIFIHRELLERIGGISPLPLLEDIDLCKRAKSVCKPQPVASSLISSSRKWLEKGTFTTIWLMWRIRLAFYFEHDPDLLARQYYQ